MNTATLDAELAQLSPAERQVLLATVKTTLARQRLVPFAERMDVKYQRAAHSALLAEHLEALERREIQKLAVEEPPRHGKSYHVSERFPAWYLGRNPDHYVMLASYVAELANGFSRKVRELLRDPTYPFNTRVSEASSAVNRWATTAGGGMVAAGVGGALTGFGAHLLVIDDPVKGRKEADSPTYREDQWAWYQEVAKTRKMPRGVELVTMTRWHEDDLLGRILNSKGASEWTLLRLPAVAEAREHDDYVHLRRPDLRELDDPLGRRVGEALWPAWKPLIELPSVEAGEISQRGWLSLYQQRPSTPEGNQFKRAWMTNRYDARALPRFQRVIQVVDSAFKEGVATDWTVIATWGETEIGYYLLDQWRGQVDFVDLVQAITDQWLKWRVRVPSFRGVYVEDKASGQSAIQYLRKKTRVPVLPWPEQSNQQARALAQLSKAARADEVTPYFAAGRVWLPDEADWLPEWIEEHVGFPNLAHDDRVDTTTIALIELALGVGKSKGMVTW